MELFYKLGVRFYAFLVRIASLWNSKASKWVQGRAESWVKLAQWQKKELPTYWFHCASLGEFEQGRPLMESLKAKKTCQIVLTFFSPSGYEIRQDYELADLVLYLPQETTANAKRFIDFVQPDKVFIIKYEFWATYIKQAKVRGAEVYSVAAVFRDNQLFFKWYGGYLLKVLKSFDQIFVQDEVSLQLLKGVNIDAIVVGDPRYDRVMQNALKAQTYNMVTNFVGGHQVFLIGSSWAADEDVFVEWLNKGGFSGKVIIAPHEVNKDRISEIENKLDLEVVRYSNLPSVSHNSADVLLIDNVGMLMNLYQYATLAYVGGGFGTGLHNILEPACFGVPVIFGNKHQKFREAQEFINNNIGVAVSDQDSFVQAVHLFLSTDRKGEVLTFMRSKMGATQKILDNI